MKHQEAIEAEIMSVFADEYYNLMRKVGFRVCSA